MDAHPRQYPAPQEGAQYAKNYIADEPKAGPSHELPCQPACNEADNQNDEQAFAGHIHHAIPVLWLMRDRASSRRAIWSISIIIFSGNRPDSAGIAMRNRSPISCRIAARLTWSIWLPLRVI